jgi:hypothetical protein
MSSENPNVSPVIDLQKLSAYAIANMISNENQTDINVAGVDDRTLLGFGSIVAGDVTVTGTGSLTSSTSSTAITGTSTQFLTQVKAGNILKRQSDGATIGTVATVNSNTSITLSGNASITISTAASYNIMSAPTLSFTNSGSFGVISTNIDTADNLLANGVIGKYITISNAHSNVDGTYVITDIINQTNTDTFAGNSEKAQRRAFNIQKAANIATALMDTYTAAAGVFKDTKGGLPIRIAATAIAVGSGLARVAQISKTQFNSSNSGGGDTTPSASLPQEQMTPNFNIVGNAGTNPLAQLGNAPLQAYVVSGEVTSAQSLDRNRIKSATL